MEERTILHIDVDGFFASIEQRDNPDIKGKPVAVGSSDKIHGVIASPSIEAWRYGVKSAVATKVAKKKCSRLIILPPRMKYYKKESQKLFSIFSRYTDKIEKVSYSSAYLDITEDKTGHESALDLGTELKDVILKELGLHSTVGISVNKFMAKVAMEYKRPNGFTVIYSKDVKHYIDNLEIEKFEIFLPATKRKLQRLKIKYGRDIRKMKKADMIINFGRSAQQIMEIAEGIDNRPLKLDADLE